ncbi:protein translocase subunit SecF, partial [bacterium]|nr:protein translocase subunit SecF [bacterium]
MVIIFVVLALFVLGGESIRYFIFALLVGMFLGTYSSVFIASPLLVSWKKLDERRKSKRA